MIQNPMEQKEKIVNAIKTRGPSLPVHIASATGMNSIFAGAFLSELYGDKTIKISNMKVGGSPLYFLPGQEELLEKFFQHLNNKEKEAFLILKERKILEDTKLDPAIRVALRNLKDFAIPIAPIVNNQKILFWRFHSSPEDQAKQEIEKILDGREIKEIAKEIEIPRIQEEVKVEEIKKEIIKEEIKPEVKLELKVEKEEKVEEKKHEKVKHEHKKPVKKSQEREIQLIEFQDKVKPEVVEKSDFVKNVIKFLESENIELIEEREFRKKDYSGIVRINSDFGKIKFLLVAKDKKLISEQDLTDAVLNIQTEKMPIIFMAPGTLNKKAKDFISSYSELVKFKPIS